MLGADAEFGVGALTVETPPAVLGAEVIAADNQHVPAPGQVEWLRPVLGFEADSGAPIIGGDVSDSGELQVPFLEPESLAIECFHTRFQALSLRL